MPVFRAATHLVEGPGRKVIWDGPVYCFDLHNHPTASTAYGLACRVDGTDTVEFVAVLGEGAINSPAAALRDYLARKSRGE